MMEKKEDNTLMKARSYRGVLAEGYRLYNGNFRKLFKASWLMALVYAACCGALGTLTAIKVPELTVALMRQLTAGQGILMDTVKDYALSFLAIVGLLLLAIATMSMASATILNKLKEHKLTGTITTPPHWLTTQPDLMWRSVKGCFLTLLVTVLPLVLYVGLLAVADVVSPQFTVRHLMTTVGFFLLLAVIVALLSLPLMHVLMKYVMEAPCGYWRTLASNYGCGMRHWGGLFLVFFLSTLLVVLAGLVVTLPANILTYANQQAHQGLLIGDALNMPSYMTVLTFGTCALCSYLEFYVSQVTLVHNYYIYGSIETKEHEKNSIH
jgi:hypothetical protein